MTLPPELKQVALQAFEVVDADAAKAKRANGADNNVVPIARAKVTITEKMTFTRPAQWAGKPIPKRRWLVQDRIPAGKLCLLNGDGAAGKTTIALQLCA